MPAMSKAEEGAVYEFNSYRLDVHERLLLRDGAPVQLTPKAFELLVALVARGGRLVTKEELFQEVWAGNFVEEGNLTQNIYTLRKVLGEGAPEQTFIETVPKQGYRFVAPVRVVTPPAESQPTEAAAGHTTEQPAAAAEHAWPAAQDPHVTAQPATEAGPHDTASGAAQQLIHLSLTEPPAEAQAPVVAVPRRRARFFWPVLLLLALVAGGGAALWRWRAAHTQMRPLTVRSIAVLPFRPLGTEGNDELLGLGMADATIIKLSRVPQLSVLPTSAIYKYTERSQDPLTIGRELGVDAVLDGTVQHAGERVRVTFQLLRLADGKALQGGKFDERFTDIFTVQDSLSEQVAQVLAPQLTGEAKSNLVKRYTNNTEAYEAYVRGLYFWNKRTPDGLSRGIEYFSTAIKLDPNYALAHAGLADAYALVGFYNYEQIASLQETYEKGRAAALRALALDPSLAEAHTALAQIKVFYERDDEGAEQELKRALALNPNYATAHHRYSLFLLEQGRLGEAAQEIMRAHELDPLSAVISYNAGRVLYLQRRYDEARDYCRKALETDTNMLQPFITLALIAQQERRYDVAISELERLKPNALGTGYPAVLEALGCAYAAAGRRAEAARVIAELQGLAAQNDGIRFSLALVHAQLGELDRAFALLEERAPHWRVPPFPLLFDPRFDDLRADPRYADFLRRHEFDQKLARAATPGGK
ncbi:MAG TPA: winged helix-turn-helix domain-containing protein [Pyrinomonadaceae bacterium]|jgi:DNA-binding winged helix-turn-helix (wHTH) protein/TolB-like protein/Tfp pilus assembly protein PilF